MKNLAPRDLSLLPDIGARTHLTQAELGAILADMFKGKNRPAGQPKAWVMHGPVGAGKTTLAWKEYNALPLMDRRTTVYISADEHGVAERNPHYADAVKQADPGQRQALWARYQADHDHGYCQALRRAVEGGYSAFIDTTGAGEKGINTLKVLKMAGYHITLISCWSMLPAAVNRVMNRPRQADPAYLISKRLGAYESFEPMLDLADTLRLFYSSAARFEPGEVLTLHRTNMLSEPFASTSPHRHLLGRMITEISREANIHAIQSLDDLVDISEKDIIALHEHGMRLSRKIRSLAGRWPIFQPVSMNLTGPRW